MEPQSCLMSADRDLTPRGEDERVAALHWNVNPPRQTTVMAYVPTDSGSRVAVFFSAFSGKQLEFK